MARLHKFQQPLVSVIIPTYNYAAYIAEAIESARAQTYAHVEILVIDDGSTDDTAEVVKKWGGGVKYYKQPNGGVSSARNLGVRKSEGEYIVFLDGDDILDKKYIEKTLALLLNQDSDIGFVYTQFQYFGTSDYTTQYPGYKLAYLKVSNFIGAPCLIKSVIAKRFPYDTRFAVWEDWDFYLTLAENSIFGVLLNEPLLYYRKHDDGRSALDTFTDKKKLHSAHLLRTKHWRMYGYVETAMHWVWYVRLICRGLAYKHAHRV